MGKISTVISESKIESPNLELSSNEVVKNVSKTKKKVINNILKKPEINSINIFKKLIIITSLIFSFGGLGFGLALRYGQYFDIYESQNLPVNNLLITK